jgi:MYXO-CTERM domain-containing protein
MECHLNLAARLALKALGIVTVLGAVGVTEDAHAQNCNSSNPADWPAAAKPYFLLMVDTSGSMTSGVGSTTSCTVGTVNYGSDRRAHARCAVRNTLLAYSGQVNFGLATFARTATNCSNNANGSCNFGSCTYGNVTGNSAGGCGAGCGPEPAGGTNSSNRAGSLIRVAMLQDIGSPASNVSNLLTWVNGSCGGNGDPEIFADGCTPLNGMLRDAFRYYSNQWVPPASPGGMTLTSPLTSAAMGERACRSVNVILLTDGDETCDTQADAVDAAGDLLAGFTKDSISWSVRTHVINFAGGSTANTNAIAAAGGTTQSYLANNETELSLALSDIIAGSIKPEDCNNVDDNCNTCVDEGYVKYCNTDQTCCAWTTPAQRSTCLTNYANSLNTNPPDGNLALLPCTTPAQQQNSATWLCFNPGDECDDIDNNCAAGIDEGSTKCGNPLQCPSTEICDAVDNDCDGLTNEGSVCGTCTPSPEICDGCDNDCDGVADDGIAPVACGLMSPPNCAGTVSCNPPQNVPIGGCAPGGGFGSCTNSPQTELCDGIDNDCDGIADDNVAPTACVPPNTPNNLVYGGTSQCQQGQLPCGGQCTGFVGPSAEICDGIDNDCDGQVDEALGLPVGQQCGISTAPCSPGTTQCVNGALTCVGGVPPGAEVCDGIDNDCDGTADEAPLSDAPLPGQNGCWQGAGNCCTFGVGPLGVSWCPPPGGTCNGTGTLVAPCNTGTLVCAGLGGWACQGGTLPSAEVCDGVDNDCDGNPDDGSFPGEGAPCGLTAPAVMNCTPGDCVQGTIQCTAGQLDCIGDVPPVGEICNGKDDNCDGSCDNGIPIGGACALDYDTSLYPGDRTAAPCMPGNFACDGSGGLVCVGGVGPSPEVCDGIDNDCDGSVDEAGPAPDGLNGTANPLPPPAGNIGEACGVDAGTCQEGVLACVNGLVQCINGVGPQPEACDCSDNDCNGVNDNQNPNDDPPLCGEGKDCIQAAGSCQCAAPCSSGEFPCPTGQKCERVVSSETGMTLGNYCVVDNCLDCPSKTVTNGAGDVVCAPAGTPVADCNELPECVCKGQFGCQPPCFNVTCDAPTVCAPTGDKAGTCVVDNCFNLGCPGCDSACNDDGGCVENPCAADTCPPGEVCKPTENFTSFECVGSCAEVDCRPGSVCKDGVCVPTCAPECMAGQFCDLAQDPPTCVDDLCGTDPCPNGGCCDPIDGSCGACPCEGVVCPSEQTCEEGECVANQGQGGGGAGGGASTGGGGEGNNGTGNNSQTGGSSSSSGDPGVWGLATGGGGCACRSTAAPNSNPAALGLGAAALALAGLRRRRKKTPQVRAGEEGSR